MNKYAMNMEEFYKRRQRKKFIRSNRALMLSLLIVVFLAAADLAAAAYIRKSLRDKDISHASISESAYQGNIEYMDFVDEHFTSKILEKSTLESVGEIALHQIEGAKLDEIICRKDLFSIQGSSKEYSGIMNYCNFVDKCQGVKGNVIIESISRENQSEYWDYNFLLSVAPERADEK